MWLCRHRVINRQEYVYITTVKSKQANASYQAMNVEFERRVVALFGVVEMNEEEDVRPDVMFVVDVVFEALTDR